MIKFLIIFICLSLLPKAFLSQNFTILVANDMHSLDQFETCSVPSQAQDKFSYPYVYKYGRIGQNPPLSLINMLFSQMHQQNSSPDILLLLGDYPAHSYAQDPAKAYSKSTYSQLKSIIQQVTNEAKTYYPSTIMLPVLGNNDFKFNYQVPKTTEKHDYYQFLFRIWFEEHEPNRNLDSYSEIKETFLAGGFYKLDYDSNLRIIVLNTMYYARSNKELIDPKTAVVQLKWFQRQMIEAKEKNMQVILIYHVFPGYCYGVKKLVYNFKEVYTKFFEKMLRVYRKNILMSISAHTHISSFRAHKFQKKSLEKTNPKLKRFGYFGNTFISPSMSPVYRNNPGYSTFYLEKNNNYTARDMLYTHFDLYNYNKWEELSKFEQNIKPDYYFFNYSFTNTYGVHDLSPKSVRKAIKKAKTSLINFREHLMWTFGIKDSETFEKLAKDLIIRVGLIKDKNTVKKSWKFDKVEKCKYFCVMKEILETRFDVCVKKCNDKKKDKVRKKRYENLKK